MPRFLSAVLILLLLYSRNLPAQSVQAPENTNGNTYALIVGISSYELNGIPRLDFAHRDAQEFARFLRSPNGGNVPEDNIRLLLNEQANYASIYNSLYWLLDTCRKNDIVYFYFSGHGDVENNTIYKLGFLLAANTPRFNYINSAVRIEDVNNIANTISVQKGARVVIITDACRSGNLAGKENKGNLLVGEQLRMASGNEVRITSCGPEELSNEDEGWAGGRGVFSYYLVKGLEGLADYSRDKIVTLNELKQYLKNSILTDPLMAQKEHKQNPVLTGPEGIKLAEIKSSPSQSMVQMAPAPVAEGGAGPSALGLSPQGFFLNLTKGKKLEDLVDFNELSEMNQAEIPFRFIDSVVSKLELKEASEKARIEKLLLSLRQNKDALQRFTEKLVELMADRGQELINLYLEGDEAELEKRRYYNSLNNAYDTYIKMFATALKLAANKKELAHMLQVKYNYFKGISYRLKIPLTPDPKPFIDSAMKAQLKALELEDGAAYVHNELGILYLYQKNETKALQHLLRATMIAPTWAIPWVNLSGIYLNKNKLTEAGNALDNAWKLQPEFQGNFVNTGLLQERKGNLLLAEEYFRKSIRMNSRHYLPFERMGYVCMNTTRYAEADSNFLEADKRKRGYNFIPTLTHYSESFLVYPPVPPPPPCNFDTTKVKPDDAIGHFMMGLNYVDSGDFNKAESKFKQVIRIDPRHPLAFHALGKILFDQQRWKEAALIFNYAEQYHLDTDQFKRYCDSLLKFYPQYDSNGLNHPLAGKYPCVMNRYRMAWREKKQTSFYLGTVYEKWNHFEEAEIKFRRIIREFPDEMAAYYKLFYLLENTGRYADANKVIQLMPDKEAVINELFGFYRRMIKRQPGKGEWYYHAGALMVDFFSSSPDRFSHDKKFIVTDSDEEKYHPSGEFYNEQLTKSGIAPGTAESFVIMGSIGFPLTEAIKYLKKADSLINDEEMLAEINDKIGNCYVWQGLPQRADRYYKKSVSLQPSNANTRSKFVHTSIINFNYGIALEQLDSLYSRKEINYSDQLTLARFSIHAGRFAAAAPMLTEARNIHPYRQDEITDLEGRLLLLSNKPLPSISVYKDFLSRHPNQAETMYSIARLYAKTKNSNEAWNWLSKSVKAGFNYFWVLKYDESWNDYRSSPKWTALTGSIKSKE